MSSERIRTVRRARFRAASMTMAVHALAADSATPQLAVVASRVVGGAVARNRAKRRLRAAVRAARLPASVDLVIDARARTIAAPFTQLRRDLERLSARAAEQAG